MIWAEFAVCAVLLVLASTVLSRYADVLAEKTGWGRASVGAILLAGVVIVSPVYRASPRTPYPPYRVSWDAVAPVAMCAGTMTLLYGMGR